MSPDVNSAFITHAPIALPKSALFEAPTPLGPPPQTAQEHQICDCSLTSTHVWK